MTFTFGIPRHNLLPVILVISLFALKEILKLFCLHNREVFYMNSMTNIDPIALLLSRLASPSPCSGFTCDRNLCLSRSKICDGIPDCQDRSDEKHCSKYQFNYCSLGINPCVIN